MKVIIIGGVAAGASAAARLRRLDETAEITVYERTGFVSYANCALPYFIGGVIQNPGALTLRTPGSFRQRFGIEVKVSHEVLAIHPAEKTVTVRNLETGEEFRDSYDKLLLAPGAKPTRPELPGMDSPRIFTLRTVEDTMRIRKFVEENQPKTAVLTGGGYIGLEMAENLTHAGVSVTIVQRPKQVLNTFDGDMAAFAHAELRANGVNLCLGSAVTGFRDCGDGIETLLESGEARKADMVILAIGVTPESDLAAAAGLQLGVKGSIAVNSHMETSVPGIYAAGDVVEVEHLVSGQKTVIPLAGPANKQGRIAADNMCGIPSEYRGGLGSAVVKLFSVTAACTGLNEKTAKAAGIDYDRIVFSPSSHADYYPGAKQITVKVLFEKGTYRLLGAQIIGGDGVEKRLDVLATAISAGMPGYALKELELSYAPPYSSAKDPVNFAGFILENLKLGMVKQAHWDELPDLPWDGSVTLLDVRTPAEYGRGHAPGFINVELDGIREHLDQIPAGKPVYVMCQTAIRSYIACRILSQNGYDCYNISGGYRFWSTVTTEQKRAEECWPCGMEKV